MKPENQRARKRRAEDTREDGWIQKERLMPDKLKMLWALSTTALQIKTPVYLGVMGLCY